MKPAEFWIYFAAVATVVFLLVTAVRKEWPWT